MAELAPHSSRQLAARVTPFERGVRDFQLDDLVDERTLELIRAHSSVPASSAREQRKSCCRTWRTGSTSGSSAISLGCPQAGFEPSPGSETTSSCGNLVEALDVERMIVAFSEAPHAETLCLINRLNTLLSDLQLIVRTHTAASRTRTDL